MEALIIIIYVYILLYAVNIARLIAGYGKVRYYAAADVNPKTEFSIVVPFRNEEKNLPRLLESIKNINYPEAFFEVILVDDFSDDNSQSLIYKWRMANPTFKITLIESVRMTGSPKKDAILRAIPIAVSDWIITTDADCSLPPEWLSTYNGYILSNDVSMIAGPVVYDTKFSFLHLFQQADLLSLQAATIGSFGIGKAFMCNGANLAYTKKLFNELSGFSGNSKIPGGDDVFLLQKATASVPEKVHYLKSRNSIVATNPAVSWKELFNQRVRWASKASFYQSDYAEALSVVVFLGNLITIVAVILALGGFMDFRHLIAIAAIKVTADWILMFKANSLLRNGRFFLPLLSSVIYPFFCVAVAVYSLFGSYQWKGRTFSNRTNS